MDKQIKTIKKKLLQMRLSYAEGSLRTAQEKKHRLEIKLNRLLGEFSRDDILRESSETRFTKINDKASSHGTGYYNYRITKLSENPYVTAVNRLFSASRKYVLLTRLMRYTAVIVSILETSASFVITLLCFLALLPFTAILYTVYRLMCIMTFGKLYNKIKEDVASHGVTVIIYTDSVAKELTKGYCRYCLSELGKEGITLAIPRKTPRTYCLTVKQLDNGVYLCSKRLLSFLKKKNLADEKTRVIWL